MSRTSERGAYSLRTAIGLLSVPRPLSFPRAGSPPLDRSRRGAALERDRDPGDRAARAHIRGASAAMEMRESSIDLNERRTRSNI